LIFGDGDFLFEIVFEEVSGIFAFSFDALTLGAAGDHGARCVNRNRTCLDRHGLICIRHVKRRVDLVHPPHAQVDVAQIKPLEAAGGHEHSRVPRWQVVEAIDAARIGSGGS